MGWSRFEYEADSSEFPGLQETELTVVAYKGKKNKNGAWSNKSGQEMTGAAEN